MKLGKLGGKDSGLTFVLVVFVVSRVLFFGVGAGAAVFLPWAAPAGEPLEPAGFLNYWAHWDGAWYSEIATEGYGPHAPESTAFFPLYPLLVGVGTALGGGPAFWGVLISTTATFFATYFLYRITEEIMGAGAARAAALAFALFPTAFFLNAVYTEALFVALSTGSLWAARVRRDLLLAGVLAALASATRNFGVLLLIPLAHEWLRDRRGLGWRGAVGLLLVPAGLAGYLLLLWARFGDPLIFFSQQGVYWGRVLTNPSDTLDAAWARAWEGAGYFLDPATLFLDPSATPALEASNTTNFVFLTLFLVFIGIGFVVLPFGLSAYAFLVTLLPLATPSPYIPLLGLPRYVLGAFPLFLIFGYLFSRSRPVLYLWLSLSIGVGVALTALFVTWRWVA